MDRRVYWLWLQEALGPGSPLPGLIFRSVPGGAEGFYQAGPRAWEALPGLAPRQKRALAALPPERFKARLAEAEGLGFSPLTLDCPPYPELLRQIYAPPAVLYVRGSWPDFSAAPAIAVVGARRARSESRSAARRIAFRLAKSGAVLVSGTARGIDAAALAETLRVGGRAVSVLPALTQNPYPSAAQSLHQRLLREGGALASECFSGRLTAKQLFSLRNRIITGLCQGTVIIQAGLPSGAMGYADPALEQGREVWVYPGRPGDPAFAGSRLLLEEGAPAVWNGWDVVGRCPGLGAGGSESPGQADIPREIFS